MMVMMAAIIIMAMMMPGKPQPRRRPRGAPRRSPSSRAHGAEGAQGSPLWLEARSWQGQACALPLGLFPPWLMSGGLVVFRWEWPGRRMETSTHTSGRRRGAGREACRGACSAKARLRPSQRARELWPPERGRAGGPLEGWGLPLEPDLLRRRRHPMHGRAEN